MATGDITDITESYYNDGNLSSSFGAACRLTGSNFYVIAVTGLGFDGYLAVVEITADGSSINWIDWEEFETGDAKAIDIGCIRCDTSCYILLAYEGGSSFRSWMRTYEINPSTGMIIGSVDYSGGPTAFWYKPRIFRFDTDHWLYTYQQYGEGYGLYAAIGQVNNSDGDIISGYTTREEIISSTDYEHATVEIGSNYYLSIYPDDSNNLRAVSFYVNPSTYAITVIESNINLSESISGLRTAGTNRWWGCKVQDGVLAFALPGSYPKVVTVTCDADGTNITKADSWTSSNTMTSSYGCRIARVTDNMVVLTAPTTQIKTQTLNISDTGSITDLDYQLISSGRHTAPIIPLPTTNYFAIFFNYLSPYYPKVNPISISTVPAPSLSELSPSTEYAGVRRWYLIDGTNLDDASSVDFGADTTTHSFTVNPTGTQILADVTIDPGAAEGNRDVTVTTPGGADTINLEVLIYVPDSVSLPRHIGILTDGGFSPFYVPTIGDGYGYSGTQNLSKLIGSTGVTYMPKIHERDKPEPEK